MKKKKKKRLTRILIMGKVLFSIIILLFASSCLTKNEKIVYHFNLNGEVFGCEGKTKDRPFKEKLIIETDSLGILTSDSKGKLISLISNNRSNVNGIFYLNHNDKGVDLLLHHIDTFSIFNIEQVLFDLDRKAPSEVITFWWSDGDVYYVTVDKFDSSVDIKSIYTSRKLSITWIGVEKLWSIEAGQFYLNYMSDDADSLFKVKMIMKNDTIQLSG